MKQDRQTRSDNDIRERVRRAEAQRREYLHGLFSSALQAIVRRVASLGRRSQEKRPLAAG